MKNFENLIHQCWDSQHFLKLHLEDVKQVIQETFDKLNSGALRVCEKNNGVWHVNEWIKKTILLSFRLTPNKKVNFDGFPSLWYDKVPLKCEHWSEEDFSKSQTRMVPGSVVREGSYIGPKAVIMPSFVNVGAYIGEGTMIDTWSTVGSCAQIGKYCHISGGVGIGGVLEPLQSSPVIIEDNCFIGARSEIAEGVIVEDGAVLSMGVFIAASTKIVDRETGEIIYGRIPAYSVVVPGTLSSNKNNGLSLACAVIVKRVDEKTRKKTSVNNLLRCI